MNRGSGVFLAALGVIFLALAVGGAGFQWVNSQPWFCNSCHEMNFHYDSWQASTHGAKATCLECHSEPGVRGFIEEKARGAEQVVAHFTGNYKTPIQILVRVKNDQCLACHPDTAALTDQAIQVNHAKHIENNVLCADCHNRIVHAQAGQARVMPREQCDSCHKAHAGFQMVGMHATLNCNQCHKGDKYQGTSPKCEACHQVPSNHPLQVTTGCEQCHDPTGWQPAKFDHSSFALTGKHQSLTCEKCHAGGKFQGTSRECGSCHQPPAGHPVAVTSGCEQCHSPAGWQPAKFNHAKFPLTGRHQNVTCDQCHKNGVYAGTSSACASCHQPPVTHAGMDSNCATCHTPAGFAPANFTHQPVGEHMGASAERPIPCTRCHPVNFKTTTCMGSGCHSSNNPQEGAN